MLDTDLATARKQVHAGFDVLAAVKAGVRLRIEAETLDWVARELARFPFAFEVRRPPELREAVARLAQRLMHSAHPTLLPIFRRRDVNG